MNIIRIILFPVACLYGFFMTFRNKLFDWGILPSESFNIPIISVGNLSYGGTGKTPHIEYLIRLLQNNFKIATLSRGYGRKSSGFVLANKKSTYFDIGDESLQYKQKFDKIEVCVDAYRRRGIKILKNLFPKLGCILLDDAYQHRFIKPGLSILLTDYHKLFVNDYPIPTGTLRECRSGFKRADIIIVTKTFSVFSPITKRRITELIKPLRHQKLYFSYVKNGDFVPIPGVKQITERARYNTILLFAGIANLYPLQEYLKTFCSELITMNFPDHHRYTSKDIEKIKHTYAEIFSRNKIIITTEKDAMRIIKTDLIKQISELPVYYTPIEIKFHAGGETEINNQILEYVKTHPGNSKLYNQPI
ncbi:MAG: tetraacyldisaccharide 4'-kinase [Bacteroidetes bacterium HGW-Bacteroidetes-17]|nr:MAG: tetraacyldisaccharide 4'-kinase [Bacteroidetes bacterium HGW-Bacteroidetes-17]